jgi:hypothetical protein
LSPSLASLRLVSPEAGTARSGANAFTTTPLASNSGLISGTLLVPSGLSSLQIDTLLHLNCRFGAICDFANTGSFRFGALPAGISLTSESGVFLSAVPEPGVARLLGIAGLALFGAQRKRVAEAA